MRRQFRPQWLSTLLIATFSAGALAAPADVQAPAPATEPKSRPIEEMVVTAQKRETNLQKTPIAITAFGSEQIERDRIADFRDIALRTPSMTFTQLQGYSQIAMRGVGLDLTNLSAETSVALYEDGVYRGASFLQGMPSFDMERIEILRGPQGTLYGRNATAGAANIITKLPSETPGLNASLEAGNYSKRRLDVGVTGPIVKDVVDGRLSFVYDDRGGYRRNVTLHKDEDDSTLKAVRGSLLFKPTEDLSFVLRGDYAKKEGSDGLLVNLELSPTPIGITPANVGGLLTFPNPALGGASLAQVFGLTIPKATEPLIRNLKSLKVSSEDAASRDVVQKGVSGTLTWKLGEVTAKVIGAYRDNEMKFVSDSDGTDLQILTNHALQTNKQWTGELNLSGTTWGDKMQWLVGGYYYKDDGLAQFFYDLKAYQTTFEALFGLGGGAPLPQGSLFVFGKRLTTGAGSATPFLDFRINQKSESKAVYGQSTFSFTDALRLTLGARYTTDQKQAHRELTNNLGGTPCDNIDHENWSKAGGTAILDYNITEETLAYLSLSKGYKAGGYNPGECGAPFNPENIISYEAGVKTTFADGRVRLNGAIFKYNYKDIQVNRFINNASVISNAAQADIQGAELEFVVAPGGGFTFDGGVNWLDTQYGGNASFQNPIVTGPLINVDGNHLLRSPEWKLYVAGQYDLETSVGRFAARLDAAYSAKYYFDVFEASLPNQSEMEQGAYWISNARLTWSSLDGKYEAQAFVQNLTDEIYAETRQAIGTTGAVIGELSAPRTFGVRVTARLGE